MTPMDFWMMLLAAITSGISVGALVHRKLYGAATGMFVFWLILTLNQVSFR